MILIESTLFPFLLQLNPQSRGELMSSLPKSVLCWNETAGCYDDVARCSHNGAQPPSRPSRWKMCNVSQSGNGKFRTGAEVVALARWRCPAVRRDPTVKRARDWILGQFSGFSGQFSGFRRVDDMDFWMDTD